MPLIEVTEDFTVLLATAKAGSLLPTLTAKDASLTIFTLTDDAFDKVLGELGITLQTALADKAIAEAVVKYYVLPAPVKAAGIKVGTKLPTLMTPEE